MLKVNLEQSVVEQQPAKTASLEQKYFEEGRSETDDHTIYLGTNYKKNKGVAKSQTVTRFKESGQYKGKVLFPEASNEKWTYEINKAFIQGGIEARKKFVVVTPKSHYVKNGDYITTTIDETAWLLDSGYTHHEERNGTITFSPPEESSQKDKVFLQAYHCGVGSSANKAKLLEVKKAVFGEHKQPKNKWRRNTTITEKTCATDAQTAAADDGFTVVAPKKSNARKARRMK